MKSRIVSVPVDLMGVTWVVEGKYLPGCPALMHAQPDRCIPGDGPDWENVTVKTDCAGTDLADFLGSVLVPNDPLHRSAYEVLLEKAELILERGDDY